MRFRVVCVEEKSLPENPFRPTLINETSRTRTWEMDCESEEAVRQFFDDAKKKDLPNVRGFKLQSVAPI